MWWHKPVCRLLHYYRTSRAVPPATSAAVPVNVSGFHDFVTRDVPIEGFGHCAGCHRVRGMCVPDVPAATAPSSLSRISSAPTGSDRTPGTTDRSGRDTAAAMKLLQNGREAGQAAAIISRPSSVPATCLPFVAQYDEHGSLAAKSTLAHSGEWDRNSHSLDRN